MLYVIEYLKRFLTRRLVVAFFRNKTTLYAVALVLLLIFSSKVFAGDYEFRGVYKVQTILLQYCEDCWLELPPDYLQSDFTLAVNTDKEKSFFKSLQASSRAIGWELTKNGNKLKAEPVQNADNLIFISCMDFEPRNVPKYLYSSSIKADSIKCFKRDSLANYEQIKNDSLFKISDSLAKLPPLEFANFELRYFSFAKSYADYWGFDWQEILASGNLHNKLKVYDSWLFRLTETNDTAFTYRSMFFSVDSSLSLDWGSEEQTLEKTFNDNGVISQSYEWRKYGLIITISRTAERVKLDYTFRDKGASIGVLQGSAIANTGDTLFLQGNYSVVREYNQGIPILSKIPIVNFIASNNIMTRDLQHFDLFLIPQEQKNIDSLKTQHIIHNEVKNETSSSSAASSSSAL